MRVLCVREPNCKASNGAAPIIKERGVYNVIDTVDNFYELSEHVGYIYSCDLFIPISDISETNFQREYNKLKSLQ